MTLGEFKQFKELKSQVYELCQKYIEKRETFDNPDTINENEWNFIDDYDIMDDTVVFLVDTSGYKYEGQRYTIFVPIEDILNEK